MSVGSEVGAGLLDTKPLVANGWDTALVSEDLVSVLSPLMAMVPDQPLTDVSVNTSSGEDSGEEVGVRLTFLSGNEVSLSSSLSALFLFLSPFSEFPAAACKGRAEAVNGVRGPSLEEVGLWPSTDLCFCWLKFPLGLIDLGDWMGGISVELDDTSGALRSSSHSGRDWVTANLGERSF